MPDAPPPPGSAGDYRPDLRPMLILLGLLVAVVVGWILLSPLVLPPPQSRPVAFEPYPFTSPIPDLAATPVDGSYDRGPTDSYAGTRVPCVRCPPYPLDRGTSLLMLDRGRWEVLHQVPRYRTFGHFSVEGAEIVLFNDPECTDVRGRYAWEADDGTLRLELVDDPCAFGQRAADLTALNWTVTAADRCDPPDTEAAVTGHWKAPPGC